MLLMYKSSNTPSDEYYIEELGGETRINTVIIDKLRSTTIDLNTIFLIHLKLLR
jgi:hypothetical protein